MSYQQLEAYRSVNKSGGNESVAPYKIVKLLLQGAVNKLIFAKSCVTNNEYTAKGESISRAIDILAVLQASLDKEKGEDIAENLDKLYHYMITKCVEANAEHCTKTLDEVIDLIKTIQTGWNEIDGQPRITGA